MGSTKSDTPSQSSFVSGRFVKKSSFPIPVESLFSWHERDGAIERLSPPWDPLKVIYKSGGIQPEAKVILGMKEGPVRFKWHAVHTDYEQNRLFRDMQTRGPLSSWIHTHRFESLGENQSTMEDTIEYKSYFSWISRYLMDPFIKKKLSRIFTYRHKTTTDDLKLHQQFIHLPRKRVLISGASGLIGQKLIPFLKTGGHTVLTLVRREPAAEHEIFWDPVKGVLNADDLAGVDAIIHLSGENVGEGRWTKAKKQRIIESRQLSTDLLSRTASCLNPKPEVFISASATGYYGDTQQQTATEESRQGGGFLASVCKQWEEAAQPVVKSGIRTVFMRIGVVITPEGGALGKLLLPYQFGLGGRIGSGSQFMSWISIDDVVSAFYWALMNEKITGPLNAVSPNPVSSLKFSKTLASVLHRPAILPLPAFLIKILFGQMGVEGLLYSTKVNPTLLLNSGFHFRHLKLDEVFKHVLGK